MRQQDRPFVKLLENQSLKPFNSFSLPVSSRYFLDATSEEEILSLLSGPEKLRAPLFILGGGSNVLFLDDWPGTVLRVGTRGIVIPGEDSGFVEVKAQAGENWDEFVAFCVEKGWGGLENLSLIPGNVGASPVQNIGAYGVELKDVLREVEALDLKTLEKKIFPAAECGLDYRESVFKSKWKDRFLILSATFRLTRKPELHLGYKDIQAELARSGISRPEIRDVRETVIAIRRRKLPDPAVIGNAGSFFKNPVVTGEKLEMLKESFPGIVSFQKGASVKLAAAWMIEQCGWKGKRFGDAGVHKDHALVLVNHGKATGREILGLAMRIRDSVQEKFGITLETEVNLVGG
ncbi:MAG TPA: UDP-N-acetylmuramate dehydrogenase [Bacteroidales bacterium]|nr:UDP-N-acetylmuramate dehydrogenase [Bacteroidales bacterium]